MLMKGPSSDVLRASISSAPSTSSHGSAQDECDSLGDVSDILLPKPLESSLVLDVYHVDCGVKHAALVTKNDPNSANRRKESVPYQPGESNGDAKVAKANVPSNMDMIRSLDIKAARQGKRTDGLSFLRNPQVSSLLQLSDIALSGGLDMNRSAPRAVRTSATRSVTTSRAVSPFSHKPSPPRSTTPVPTAHGLSLSKSATDNIVKANELLNQEVERLRAQVDNLRNRCELQELDLQKSAKKVQEAMTLVAEESAKSKAAKEVIKSLTAQLKDMAERLPPDHCTYNVNETKQSHIPNGIDSHVANYSSMNAIHPQRNELLNASIAHSPNSGRSSHSNGISGQHKLLGNVSENSDCSTHSLRITSPHDSELPSRRARSSSDEMLTAGCRVDDSMSMDARSLQNGEDGYKPRGTISASSNQVQAEWIEQYEPGVYITLTTLRDGTRDLKRVRFSRRRFGEHQAENWWNENREKVYERYNVKSSERVSSAASTRSAY
nr:unnamed protein product [Digitaria exilis]